MTTTTTNETLKKKVKKNVRAIYTNVQRSCAAMFHLLQYLFLLFSFFSIHTFCLFIRISVPFEMLNAAHFQTYRYFVVLRWRHRSAYANCYKINKQMMDLCYSFFILVWIFNTAIGLTRWSELTRTNASVLLLHSFEPHLNELKCRECVFYWLELESKTLRQLCVMAQFTFSVSRAFSEIRAKL